jgi:hypothetical protein
MANLFDADQAREGEPTEIVVGDFIQWKRSDLVDDYPLSEYSVEYVARITGGGSNEIKVAATETGGTYLITVDSATSAEFVAGYYHWQLEVTKTSTGDRVVVDRGAFTAVVDLDDNQADPRLFEEKMLAKIETILLGKADADVSSYSIAGRSLTKYSYQELQDLHDQYEAKVNRHKQLERIKLGKTTHHTVKVRFS